MIIEINWSNRNRYHSKNEKGKKGEKGFKFFEEGSFRKGHSIKGSHVIHKLNESEKKNKFFDEDYDGGYDEKHDDFHEKFGSKKGGSHKKGHFNKSFAEKGEGKSGHGKHTKHHSDESGDYKGNSFFFSLLIDCNTIIRFAWNLKPYFLFTGYKGVKGDEGHYDHKSTTAKKGGSKKGKQFHHKKSGHWLACGE